MENGVIKILFVKSEGNLADGFTKSTGIESHMRSFAYMDEICSDGWHHNKGGCWDILYTISRHEEKGMIWIGIGLIYWKWKFLTDVLYLNMCISEGVT